MRIKEIKIDMTFTEQTTLTLQAGDNGRLCMSIDPANGFIYGGCSGSGAHLQ